MEEEYDVCIIGSGPAGAAVARSLSGSGLKTAILEKQRLPRYKMCSGMLVPEALERIHDSFGIIPENILATPREFKGIRLYPTKETPPDEPVEMLMPSPLLSQLPNLADYILNVPRAELDYWLCKQSDAAILDGCKFMDFCKENRKIVVEAYHRGEKLEIKTGYLVGADGSQSRVRKVVFPDFFKQINHRAVYEEHYIGKVELDTERWFYAFLDKEFSQGFATFHRQNGRLVTVASKAKFAGFRQHLESVHGLAVEERVHRHGIVLTDMPFRGNFCLGKENILLCGEAAGFTRFLNEGITAALITGQKAGESILASMETGKDLIDLYARAVESEMELIKEQHQQYSQIPGTSALQVRTGH